MPESAQEWYDRVSARIAEEGYRELGWSEWETWPFEGELVPHGWEEPAFDDSHWDEPLAPYPAFLRGQHGDPGDVRWRLVPRDIPSKIFCT